MKRTDLVGTQCSDTALSDGAGQHLAQCPDLERPRQESSGTAELPGAQEQPGLQAAIDEWIIPAVARHYLKLSQQPFEEVPVNLAHQDGLSLTRPRGKRHSAALESSTPKIRVKLKVSTTALLGSSKFTKESQ